MTAHWTFVLTDSLETVLATSTPRQMNRELPRSAFLDETYSFQLAFHPPASARVPADELQIQVAGSGADYTRLSTVDLVPAVMPAFPDHDDNYLVDEPGLYPDVLRPIPDGRVQPRTGHWRSVWFDLCLPHGDAPSESPTVDLELEITVRSMRDETVLYADMINVTVINQQLPPLDIVNTQWLHADCLLDYYGGAAFDDDHWQALDAYVASAARMGITGLLTPIWTPPLDTDVGARRTPVQLVDIRRSGDQYEFGFAKLERWLAMLARHQISYVELAHLFTQWGAEATPAIDAEVDGQLRQIFGWHVPATDPTYRQFLEQFLPALRQTLERLWDPNKIIFHISDEPRHAQLESYRAARNVVSDLLDGCLVVDALSDYDFYTQGLVDQPVVATDHADPFLQAEGRRPWLYYCVSQNKLVANRFIAMPLARQRVIGQQLFISEAGGFLQWGFNFYNTVLSRSHLDPYHDTCAGGAFPAGDPFIVYPGPDRTVRESTRHRVAAQAFHDHRALQLLRDRHGHQQVIDIIDPQRAVTLTEYPRDPEHFLSVREQVNAALLR